MTLQFFNFHDNFPSALSQRRNKKTASLSTVRTLAKRKQPAPLNSKLGEQSMSFGLSFPSATQSRWPHRGRCDTSNPL